MLRYELVDLATGNHVGVYPSQDAALEVVVSSVNRYGDGAALSLALGVDEGPAAAGRMIAEGSGLVSLARSFEQAKVRGQLEANVQDILIDRGASTPGGAS